MGKHKFTMVTPSVWRSGRFRQMPNDSARLLFMYLLSNPHQNSIGAYRLPDGYALADLGWESEKYEAARTALITADMAVYDPDTEEVMVRRWFQNCPPQNEKHEIGMRRMVEMIESDEIRGLVETEFQAAVALRKSNVVPLDPANSAGSRLADTPYLNGRRGALR
jgi:hypothetical protein